jgi:hypothetical protein
MPVRHLLRVALFCGALGIVGGQTAHAQNLTPSSVRFVSLLLANETKLIQNTFNAFNTRNANILKLNSATSQRQINQLNKILTRLNTQVLTLTTQLSVLSPQAYNYAKQLSPANPALVSQTLAALLTVQALQVEAGIVPATSTH